MSKLWDIREAIEDDLPFIYNSWLKTYRYDSLIGKGCRNTIFYSYYTKIIDYILTKPETKVIVACKLENSKIQFGYLVYEPKVIHYVHVIEEFRKYGIATSLIDSIGGFKSHYIFTHKTFSVIPITKRYNELIFNPFLLFKHFIEEPANGALKGEVQWQESQRH